MNLIDQYDRVESGEQENNWDHTFAVLSWCTPVPLRREIPKAADSYNDDGARRADRKQNKS